MRINEITGDDDGLREAFEPQTAAQKVDRGAKELLTKYPGLNVEFHISDRDELIIPWMGRVNGAEKGTGATFLTELCKLADAHQVKLSLIALFGERKLIKYYKRFGFKVIDPGGDNGPIMMRMPQKLPMPSS